MQQGITHRVRVLVRSVVVAGAVAVVAVPGALAVEPPAEQLDCRVHDTEKSKIGVALKVASFLFKWGPEVSYDKERGVAWDKVVQGFIAQYKELCSRYNAGLVTKEEYEARLKEMEGLHREAMELERKMVDETRGRAKAGIDELDRTLAQRKGQESAEADPIKVSLDDLSRRIDGIDVRRKWRGERPNDSMGTMGREQQPGGPVP